MCDYNGEDLLNVFKDLNIQQWSMSPNVIKAWFDTDDRDMKYLLKWMCMSLSSQNVVSPLAIAEYNDFKASSTDEKFEQELCAIEEKYPGIFDAESNQLDISILEDEIEMLCEEDQSLDNLILMSEDLQRNLSQEWNDKLALEIRTESELLNTNDRCAKLSQDLDEKNRKLHTQLHRYGNNLYNFEFSEQPHFINNIGIEPYQDTYEIIHSILKPVVEDPILSSSCSLVPTQTFSSITSLDESMENKLFSIRKRISFSHFNYVKSKIEVEEIKEKLDFFTNNSLNSIKSLPEKFYMQPNLDSKEDTKIRMLSLVQTSTLRIADQHISSTKLKYTQSELDMHQSKLEMLSTIEELVRKFLSQYLVLYILYMQEKKDIDSSDKFFRRAIYYINQDLMNCSSRTTRMNEIIKEYHDVEPKEKFKLIKSMLKVLGANENLSLNKAFEVIFNFKNELNTLEAKIFTSSTNHRTLGKDMKDNIQILQSFLISGPTHRIISVPCKLLSAIRETEDILLRQEICIKNALDITTSMRKQNRNKWDLYRRKLWMFFYTEPHKVKFVLQQIEDELQKVKVTKDSPK